MRDRHVLRGEFYEAMHILAPQTENLLETLRKKLEVLQLHWKMMVPQMKKS